MGLSKKEIIQAVWNKIKGILGTNDISKIGDGTVTGAISSMNSNLNNQYVQGGIAKTENINGYFRSKHVTFPKAYTSTPTVVATVLNYQNNAIDVSITTLVKNASTTGVDVYIGRFDGGLDNQEYEISWIAIGSIN